MCKLLTIGIPTYNRKEQLIKLLENIQNELKSLNKNEIEVLISDNCSDYNIFELKNQFDFIKIYKNNKNIGLAKNIDEIIKKAESKYIWFMGDDDKIVKEGIINVVKTINKNNPDFLILNSIKVIENNKSNISLEGYEDKILSKKEFFSDYNLINHLGFLGVICFKKEIGKKAITSLKSKTIMHPQMIALYVISNSNKIYLNTKIVVDDYNNKKYSPRQLIDVNIISRIEMKVDKNILFYLYSDYIDNYLFDNIKLIGKDLIYWKIFLNYNVKKEWKRLFLYSDLLNYKELILIYFLYILYFIPNPIMNKIIKLLNKNYQKTKQVFKNLEWEEQKTFYLEN